MDVVEVAADQTEKIGQAAGDLSVRTALHAARGDTPKLCCSVLKQPTIRGVAPCAGLCEHRGLRDSAQRELPP